MDYHQDPNNPLVVRVPNNGETAQSSRPKSASPTLENTEHLCPGFGMVARLWKSLRGIMKSVIRCSTMQDV
jgi:hypothetical protein